MAGNINKYEFYGALLIPFETGRVATHRETDSPLWAFIEELDKWLWCRAKWRQEGLLYYDLESLVAMKNAIPEALHKLTHDPGYWALVARKYTLFPRYQYDFTTKFRDPTESPHWRQRDVDLEFPYHYEMFAIKTNEAMDFAIAELRKDWGEND